MSTASINDILISALRSGASDVHITVGIPPKMRVNGKLMTLEGFERLLPEDTQRMGLEIMNERQKEILSHRGQFDMAYAIPGTGRFRVNLFRQRGSIAIVLRVVAGQVPSATSLGIPDSVIDLYQHPRGLVLVTGPTGSGKSTTLASIIDLINNNLEQHILTLEDPIEFTYRHHLSIVNQREIGIDSDSYADALRSALREDPDVILVGEMRDLETISTAITAAETGHLVFSTLHTIGAASTVDRIIDVFQLANVLDAVVSQQLLPSINGRERVAAFEVLHVNGAVRNMIRESKTHQLITVMQTGRRLGMITMDEAIIQLYQKKKITKETAIQYAQEPETMLMKLGGL